MKFPVKKKKKIADTALTEKGCEMADKVIEIFEMADGIMKSGMSEKEKCNGLFNFRDNKRRCLFVVKRTQPIMTSACLFEFDIASHNIDNVTPAFDFLC